MQSIVQIPGKSGATGIQAQSLHDEVRHLWGRLQIQLPLHQGKQLRIAFCSTHPGEGTTTVAANFAIFLGHESHRSTLVECNLRNPSLADHFGIPRSPGICELLEGSARIDEAVRGDIAPALDVVPAGSPPSDIYATLGRKSGVDELLDSIARQSAFVVVDAPPLAVSPEAAPILQSVDAAVLVVQADRTRRRSIEKSIQTFEEIDVPCCGIVLNRVQYDVPPFIDQVL